jgi:formylglycine-generating enzyme required for sulfatase activity
MKNSFIKPRIAILATLLACLQIASLAVVGQPNGMVLIPSGASIYMDQNLVTYGQWQSVYNWATNTGYGFDNAGAGKAGNHPVQTVNWYDTLKWCNARSQLAGLNPIYYRTRI